MNDLIALLRASSDSMLDPQVMLEAVRDPGGAVVDFRFTGVNRAACAYLTMTKEQLKGALLLDISPHLKGSELHRRAIGCLHDGEPVDLTDVVFPHDARRFDVRATAAGADAIVATWRDVTERFEAAQRLVDLDVAAGREIEESHRRQALADTRFRHAMDYAAIGMCLVAPDGRFLKVNPALCALFGYDAQTLQTKTWQELTAPEFLEADQQHVDQILEGRVDSYRILKQYIHADGHLIWGDLSVSCVRDEHGRVDTLISQIVDVTGSIDATERYRLLAENVGDVVLRVSTDGVIEWVSPSAEGLLGGSPDYWIGRRARDFVPVEDRAAAADRLVRTLAGEVITDRLRVVSVDGVVHWAELRGKAFYDPSGRLGGITAVLRLIDDEVAAQQEAEDARAQQAWSDARYRRAMDTAAIGMCLLTPDGTFVEVNPVLCEFFGYDAETLMRKSWQDLTPPEFLDVGDEDRAAVFDGRRESYRLTKQYVHADGHRIWADVSVNAIRDAQGQVEHLAGQIADITDEVHTRERLNQAVEENRLLAESLQRQSDRLAAELKSAADYMASIMPTGLDGPVTIASHYLPSRELSGDCFDYRWIDDDHLLVYLIDVSGHGIEPALLSVSLHNMLRSGSLGLQTMVAPEWALTELNRLFQMGAQGDHYFTIWYGVFQASTRTLRYASAGAPPALAFGRAADGTLSVTDLVTAATPIGMFPDTQFSSRSFQVPPGCRILMSSDGAHELTLTDGQPFSWADFRILTIRLAEAARWSLDALVHELHALSPVGAFEDDCSLIELTFD